MSATAFGLDVEADFELPGLDDAVAPTGRRVRVALAADGELPNSGSERISEARAPDGRAVATADALAAGGFRLWAEGFGAAWVSGDGVEVRCAPPSAPAWRWQRFLTGQVLPFAAVLRGLEVLHASAVAVEGGALAVVAASGGGKTSVALELVLRGAELLTDDVLAVERAGGVLAHPGPGLANVRRDGSGLAPRLVRAGGARVLGEAGGEERVALPRHRAPVPLRAVVYLERGGAGERAAVERLRPVDPRLLLASTFNLALRDPPRLARQLDVCAAIAEASAIYRVACPPSVGPGALAVLLEEEALCGSAS